MNILVCINQVPDTTSKINISCDTHTFDPNGVQFVINPNDESALIKALQIKEKTAGSVTIIHVGKAESEPTLRKAFALGADRMIRIDTEAMDGFGVAKHISEVIVNQNFDLIFCGKESHDYHGGMTGGFLATLLGIDFVDDVMGIDLDNSEITLEREIDNGKEILTAQTPLLVAVQKEIISESEMRIPNMRGIMAARQAPIQIVAATPVAPLCQVISIEKPHPKSPVKMIDADHLDELIHELKNVKKVL